MALNRLYHVILGVSEAVIVIWPYLTLDWTVAAETSNGMHGSLNGPSSGRANYTKGGSRDVYSTEEA